MTTAAELLARLHVTLEAIECHGNIAFVTPAQKAELWRLLAQCPGLSDRVVCRCRLIALGATQAADHVRQAIALLDSESTAVRRSAEVIR